MRLSDGPSDGFLQMKDQKRSAAGKTLLGECDVTTPAMKNCSIA
jgi:hypothetical protein